MKQNKKIIKLASVISSLVILTSCFSNSPKGALGKCEQAGDYESVKEKIQICVKTDKGNFYFNNGKQYESALMIGRIHTFYVLHYGMDIYQKWYKAITSKDSENENYVQKLWDANVNSEDLLTTINYLSDSDPRWDSLVKSLTRYGILENLHKEAIDNFGSVSKQAYKEDGMKVSATNRQKMSDAMKESNATSEASQKYFESDLWPNLSLYLSYLKNNTGIDNEYLADEFLMEVEKQYDKNRA